MQLPLSFTELKDVETIKKINLLCLKKPYTFIPLKKIVLLISLLSNEFVLEIQLGSGTQEKNS